MKAPRSPRANTAPETATTLNNVVEMERLDLVGLAETAEMIGCRKDALTHRRQRKRKIADPLPEFPEPVAELRCGPIWLRSQIAHYVSEAKRRRGMSWLQRYDEDRAARA